MLYEDAVVDAVRTHLETAGWTITSFAHAHQHGDDIVATREGKTLRVEAKGGGSSKKGSKRYGQPFTSQQCQINASTSTFRALSFIADGDEAVVAVPDTAAYRCVFGKVLPALQRLGISVYLVAEENRTVSVLG